MRAALLTALLLVAAGCSSNDMPPLQAAVVAATSTTIESAVPSEVTVDTVEAAEVAEPLTSSGLPEGFSIDDRRCYQYDTGETLTTAVLYFSAEGESLVGAIEFGDRAGFDYIAAAGTRRGTSFSVNVSTVLDGAVDNEDWFFEPFGVELPEQLVLDVIDCDVVVDAVIAIETEVTQFPSQP